MRYQVDGPVPALFGPEHLEKLAGHAVDRRKTESKDGVEAGWIAGEDILDLNFDLAKNVINDSLHASIRIDSLKLPGDLLRAYTRTELQAMSAENPSGRPTQRQKQEAKEAAKAKLEEESKDGRFTRRKAYPILWDRLSNCLLVGTTSASVLDRVQNLFRETFGLGLTLIDAGHRPAAGKDAEALANVRPSAFVPGPTAAAVEWVSDPSSYAYLGNEFLLWLWYVLEIESDLIALPDGSEATVMLARTLGLSCPRAITGNDTLRSASPTQLPEARRAVQAGKLPRQVGVVIVRHDQQYELTIQAETLAVNGAKLPAVERGEDRVRLEERGQPDPTFGGNCRPTV